MARLTLQQLNDLHAMGEEPTVLPIAVTEIDLINAFSWYNYTHTVEELRYAVDQYILNHASLLPKNALNTFGQLPNHKVSITDCSIARMINNGNVLPSRCADRLNALINSTSLKYKIRQLAYQTADSPAERVKAVAREVFSDIESIIDMVKPGQRIDLIRFLTQKNVAGKVTSIIRIHLVEILNELIDARDKTDEQLVEGYAFLGKKLLADRIAFYADLVEKCDEHIGVKKAGRKPKKRKIKLKFARKKKKW